MSFELKPAALDNRSLWCGMIFGVKPSDIRSFPVIFGRFCPFQTSSLQSFHCRALTTLKNDITSCPANQATQSCDYPHPQSPAGTILALLLRSHEELASSPSFSLLCLFTSRRNDWGSRAVGGVMFRLWRWDVVANAQRERNKPSPYYPILMTMFLFFWHL